jgi:hypothetical protein
MNASPEQDQGGENHKPKKMAVNLLADTNGMGRKTPNDG